MDYDDEDVLFDNSHLFKYLKDAGVMGIDAEAITTPCSSSVIDPSRTNIDRNIRKSQWTWAIFTNTAWKLICAVCCFEVDFQENQIRSWKKDAFLTLAQSPLLEEDDSDFLENYYEESDKPKKTLESSKSRMTISVTILLCAYLIQRLTTVQIVWGLTTLFDAMAVIMIIHLAVLLKKFIQSFWMQQFLSNEMKSIKLILKQFEMNSSLVKRSLRLIQESELVARGFTLVSRQCPVSRLEESNLYNSQRKCPELRKTIFTGSKTCMLSFKESTLKVLHAFSFSTEENSKSQCLALIPIEEYGPCLQVNEQNSSDEAAELKHLTDNYSISALKAMFHLYSMQQSEFIRIWASHFLSGDIFNDHIDANAIQSIVTNTSKCICEQHAALHRCYNLQRCYVTKNDKAMSKAPRSLTGSNVDCFHVAVHSLDLHMQSALTRIIALADEVEQYKTISEVDSILEEKWSTSMKAINAEMLACKGCFDEGILRLGCIFKKNQQSASISQATLNICPQNNALPTTLMNLEGPVIEDQVFEAFTDAENVENSCWSDFENLLSPEEKEKKKQEKEEALRLLSELRTVISVRARDREEREDRALERQQSTAGLVEMSPQQSPTDVAEKSHQIPFVNMSDLSSQQAPSNEHDMQIVCSEVCCDDHVTFSDFSKEKKSCQIVQPIPQCNSISDDVSLTSSMNCEAKRRQIHIEDQNQDTKTCMLESNIKHGKDYSITKRVHKVSKELLTKRNNGALANADNQSIVTSSDCGGKTNVIAGCDLNVTGSFSFDRPRRDIFSASKSEHDVVKISGEISDGRLSYTSSLALMAAAKSQSMPLQEETFGDSDGDGDIDEQNCCT